MDSRSWGGGSAGSAQHLRAIVVSENTRGYVDFALARRRRLARSHPLAEEESVMKKLTLDLNALEVQSFATATPAPNRGTIHGEQQCTCPSACSCPGCPTCDGTCLDTCQETCAGMTCVTCGGQETCGYTCWTRACPCYYSDPC